MPDPVGRINRELDGAIGFLGRRRQDFADQSGRVSMYEASGSSAIGDQHVAIQVQLGLVEDQPPARASPAALERRPELFADRRGCGSVTNGGARLEVQLAREQLRDHVLGSGEHVLVGRFASRGLGHDSVIITDLARR